MKAALAELKRLDGLGSVVLGNPAYYGHFGFEAHSGLVLAGVSLKYFQAVSFSGELPKETYSITGHSTLQCNFLA